MPSIDKQFAVADSGLFKRAKYDATARTLTVWFRPNPSVEAFSGVPEDVAKDFMSAGSKSRFYHDILKPGYQAAVVG